MTVHASHALRSRISLLGLILLGAAVGPACVLDMAGTGRRAQEQPNPPEVDASSNPVGAPGEPDAAPSEVDASAPRDASGVDAAVGVRDATADPPLPTDATAPQDAAPISDARPAERDAAIDPRVDAAVDPPPEDAAVDAATDAGREADAAAPGCLLDGAFAVQLSYDVNWQGTNIAGVIPLLRPGRGTVKVWARLDMRESGGRARVQGCGTSLPEFASGSPRIGTELYSSYIPSASWDKPSMPRWDLRFQLGCREPGCSVKSGLTLTTVGARLSGTSVWPGPDGSLANLMLEDHDGDGLPGISLFARGAPEQSSSGVVYDHPPLSWNKNFRTRQLMMAVQIAFEFDGALTTCDAFGGSILQGRVENRVAACLAYNVQNEKEGMCTPEQARFADENLPEWSVNTGTFRAVRIAANSTCGAVRAAMP